MSKTEEIRITLRIAELEAEIEQYKEAISTLGRRSDAEFEAGHCYSMAEVEKEIEGLGKAKNEFDLLKESNARLEVENRKLRDALPSGQPLHAVAACGDKIELCGRDDRRSVAWFVYPQHAIDFAKRWPQTSEVTPIPADVRTSGLEAENARLRAVVDKLPKTADGVAVTTQDHVWSLEVNEDGEGKAPCQCEILQIIGDAALRVNIGGYRLIEGAVRMASSCFSTREAALASTGKVE